MNFYDHVVELLRLQKAKSVIDVGCGSGEVAKRVEVAGIKAIGLDGNPHTREITGGYGRTWNIIALNRKPDLRRLGANINSADWVVCMNVAHFIPENNTTRFVKNVSLLADEGLILTWAPEISQIGALNVKPAQDVIKLFEEENLIFDKDTSNMLYFSCSNRDLRLKMGNVFVFRRRGRAPGGITNGEIETEEVEELKELKKN